MSERRVYYNFIYRVVVIKNMTLLHNISKFEIVSHDCLGKITENKVEGECRTHGGGEKRVQDFGGIARRKENTWKTEM
jgi:hypothetical protein